ncbi:MAG: thiamine pyrophosphate-binding protein [Rhizobiaceae bacterium]|nr:thiamine pyrophosphate-binding protein [Rhizobiaceae bacterium]
MARGADLVARQLKEWGIDTAFGVLAGPMVPVFEALATAGITVVGCRHEQQAAFAAQAWGYLRRLPGIVVVGSGPAMTNTLTSMYVAKANRWPLVVLGGTVSSWEREVGGFQEFDQLSAAAPFVKWRARVDTARRIPELLRMALQQAMSGSPGPAYLDFPAESVLDAVADRKAKGLVERRVDVAHPAPPADAVGRAVELLGAAKRPLVLIGNGASWASDTSAIQSLVDAGLPFLSAPMARGIVADSHENNAGAARSLALSQADVILSLGMGFDWMMARWDRFGSGGRGTRIIHVDFDPASFVSGTPIDVPIQSDAGLAAAAIAKGLWRHTPGEARWKAWRAELQRSVVKNRKSLSARIAACPPEPLTQIHLYRALRPLLDADAIVVSDGEATLAGNRLLIESDRPRGRLDSGPTGCMGVGVPYAIGAKLAAPDRQVVAVLGDYAFGASAMEIETAARLGLDVTFVIANNSGIVGHSLQNMVFGPDGQAVGRLHPAHYEQMARMVGAFHGRVETLSMLPRTLKKALAHRGPAIVNVVVDSLDHGVLKAEGYLTTGYGMRAPG